MNQKSIIRSNSQWDSLSRWYTDSSTRGALMHAIIPRITSTIRLRVQMAQVRSARITIFQVSRISEEGKLPKTSPSDVVIPMEMTTVHQ